MKYTNLMLLVVFLALVVCGASLAKGNVYVSAGVLRLSHSDMNDLLGTETGFAVGWKYATSNNSESDLSLGYYTATHRGSVAEFDSLGTRVPSSDFDLTVRTVPVLLTERWTFKHEGSKFEPYIGYGFGFNWTREELDIPFLAVKGRGATQFVDSISEEGSTTRLTLGYQIVGGARFGDGYFLDLRYISGNTDVNTGYMLSLGKLF